MSFSSKWSNLEDIENFQVGRQFVKKCGWPGTLELVSGVRGVLRTTAPYT